MMVFKKLKKTIPSRKDMRVRFSSDRVYIWKNVFDKYFRNKEIDLYLDEENKLVGLKPVGVGSGAYKTREFRCKELFDKKPKEGGYPVEWSEKHQMVLIKIKFEE